MGVRELRFLGVVVAVAAAVEFEIGTDIENNYYGSASAGRELQGPVDHHQEVDQTQDDGHRFGVLERSDTIPAMSSCGNGRKWVALTFDDGPDALYTDSVREELDRLGVKATFFLTPLARGYDQEDLCRKARRLMQNGHELQLHTMTHPHLPELNQSDVDWEVQGGIDWMKKCRLPRPNMFRPPFGELKPYQARYLYLTYRTIIAQWNVESNDFESKLSQLQIFQNVQHQFERNVGIGNSAVILMHDYYAGKRSGIVTQVVDYFRDHGYTFVTMNQCYKACRSPVCKGNGGPSPYKDVYIP